MFAEENAPDNRNQKFSEMVNRSMHCYNGTRENSIGRFMFKNPADHLDKKLASDYLDGTLKAIAPVNVFSNPNGTLIRAVLPGQTVGQIYSYLEVPKGTVWWALKNGGYVKHGEGLFDIATLEKSLKDIADQRKALIDAKTETRISQNENPLYKIGKGVESFSFGDLFGQFKALLIIIVIGIIGLGVLKMV